MTRKAILMRAALLIASVLICWGSLTGVFMMPSPSPNNPAWHNALLVMGFVTLCSSVCVTFVAAVGSILRPIQYEEKPWK
jgi:uncharacterized membrane protein